VRSWLGSAGALANTFHLLLSLNLMEHCKRSSNVQIFTAQATAPLVSRST